MDETLEMTLRRCWVLERLNHVAMWIQFGDPKNNPKNDQPWWTLGRETHMTYGRSASVFAGHAFGRLLPTCIERTKNHVLNFLKGLSECGKRHKVYQICPDFLLPTLCRGDATWKEKHHFGKHCITFWPWLTGGMEDHLEVPFCSVESWLEE